MTRYRFILLAVIMFLGNAIAVDTVCPKEEKEKAELPINLAAGGNKQACKWWRRGELNPRPEIGSGCASTCVVSLLSLALSGPV